MKNCLKEPIQEIHDAAKYLDEATSAHLNGESEKAEELILLANMSIIREWTESIWGIGGVYSELKKVLGSPDIITKDDRDPQRMPDRIMEKALLERDGHHCRFCGIPVIRKEVREFLKKLYPKALEWGSKNIEQHAAFQAMWVQYDHLIPHARGGRTSLDNMVITCGPCNYGRMNYLIEEVGVVLPKSIKVANNGWDGLERILK